MPGGHPGHDALTKRIPSVRAEVAASPFARSVLDSIVPCPHGRDTYLLKEQVFYHACCRAGCWVRTSNVWTWLRRMMNHPDQTSAALREPSNQKAMLKFRIEELEAIWPRGEEADALAKRTLVGGELAHLPEQLGKPRNQAHVVGVVCVRGSRRLWGHILLRTDLVGASFGSEELSAIESFSDQLGLLLDGADMLGRTLEVERSLAHAEKLSAIGEFFERFGDPVDGTRLALGRGDAAGDGPLA